MKQDIKDIIKRELSDLHSREVLKINDTKLFYSELNCIPYEEVKEMYDTCTVIGMKKTCQKYGKTSKNILKQFRKYNLKPVGRTYALYDGQQIPRTVTPELITQRHQDSLTMGQGAWNEKYGIKSKSLYYKYRNYAKKYFEELAQVESK